MTKKDNIIVGITCMVMCPIMLFCCALFSMLIGLIMFAMENIPWLIPPLFLTFLILAGAMLLGLFAAIISPFFGIAILFHKFEIG